MSSAGNATATFLIQNMLSSSIEKMEMIYRKVNIFNNNHIYNPLIQFDRVDLFLF